jgi:hypothetical protein
LDERRAFLHRALGYLVDHGVRQVVDLGSGVVHDVDARVVYVERAAADDGRTVVVADFREPAEVLAARSLRAQITMTEPVAFVLVGALDLVADDGYAADLVAGYAAAAVPDSYIVVSRGNGLDDLLGDLTPVEPGIVPIGRWRAGGDPVGGELVAVARKD